MIETAMKIDEIAGVLDEIRAELAALSERIARVEAAAPAAAPPLQPKFEPPSPPAEKEVPAAAPEPIPADDLLAMSAALAAYFGVKVRVRAIRLIASAAWAQQGRVTIQASHRLDH